MSFSDILQKDSGKQKTITNTKKEFISSGCPCAVKIATYGKAYKEVSDGREVILHDGKSYYSCTRPCYEGKDKCWRHSN